MIGVAPCFGGWSGSGLVSLSLLGRLGSVGLWVLTIARPAPGCWGGPGLRLGGKGW